MSRRTALVRRPAATLADGIVTHIERNPVDVERAREQWANYVAALRGEGWDIVEVDTRDDLPDSVFIEDTVVMLGDVAVVTHPGADERKPETEATRAAVSRLGVRVEQIEAPGTFDGGDVLKVGKQIYVGQGGRTNAEGIRQFAAIAEPLGYSVTAVPMTKALHLKTAVTALPDGTIIGYEGFLDDPTVFPVFQPVTEPEGTAVVVMDEGTVLMSANAPETSRMLESRGLRVVTVDIEEFEKLEGCVTCLSVRVR